MPILAILISGIAAYAAGAVWYMALSRRWMAAAGVTEADTKNATAAYVTSFVMALVVAAGIAHILSTGAIHGAAAGTVTGFGLGALIAAPWIVNNVMFSARDRGLIWMDGLYPVIGCTVIGAVQGLMGVGGA